jgi:hypothetical protein
MGDAKETDLGFSVSGIDFKFPVNRKEFGINVAAQLGLAPLVQVSSPAGIDLVEPGGFGVVSHVPRVVFYRSQRSAESCR